MRFLRAPRPAASRQAAGAALRFLEGRARPGQRGFSLIELAVTLTIVGMLLAAVLPSAATWLRNSRIRSLAEGVHGGMQLAREEAVRRNTRVTFWLVSTTDPKVMDNSCRLSASSAAWVVSIASPAGSCGSAPSTNVAPRLVRSSVVGNNARGLKVTALAEQSGAASSLTFDGYGKVIGDGISSVTIESATSGTDARTLRIEVSSAGRIRLCDPLVAAGDDPRRCGI